jgi:hypothetical protein
VRGVLLDGVRAMVEHHRLQPHGAGASGELGIVTDLLGSGGHLIEEDAVHLEPFDIASDLGRCGQPLPAPIVGVHVPGHGNPGRPQAPRHRHEHVVGSPTRPAGQVEDDEPDLIGVLDQPGPVLGTQGRMEVGGHHEAWWFQPCSAAGGQPHRASSHQSVSEVTRSRRGHQPRSAVAAVMSACCQRTPAERAEPGRSSCTSPV